MKRIFFAVTGTVLGLLALLSFKTHSPVVGAGALPSGSAPSSTAHASGAKTSSGAPPRHKAKAAKPVQANATKTWTGQAVQTPYGIVQIEMKTTGSHIDSVRFLQLQAFDQNSQQINSYAGPILIRETLAAQSSQIDTVSGATYTSEGYYQSLQSALDQAGIR